MGEFPAMPALLAIAVAFSLGGIIKGATGFGLPLIALPTMALLLGVPHAVVVLTVPAIVTNIWQIWQFRHHREGTAFLPGFLAGGSIGVVAGTWLLVQAPGPLLSLALGLMVWTYVALRLLKPGFRISTPTAKNAGPVVGGAAGALQGVTGLAAPIGVTFIHSLRLPRETAVFAVSAMFLVFSVVQFTSVAFNGLVSPYRLLESVLALVPALLFMPVGSTIGKRLGPKTFDRIVLCLLALIGAQLLVTSVAALATSS
jgi:hypothetical protein